MTKKMVDDVVLIGAQRTIDLLNYMIQERNQLYGTIIYLLELMNTDRVIMPPIESMREYHNTFYVTFDELEGDFFVSRVKKEEEEEDGEESE
jgi:hypothetical protein